MSRARELAEIATAYDSGSPFSFRNRIINGQMVIDQRNAGASVTPADGQYTLDRWQARVSQSSKLTIQQNAGFVTPPVGYVNYLGVTSSSAYSVGSSDYFAVRQHIEGFNFADFGFGTANAQTVSISFWVRSSLTGTFGGSLNQGSGARSYPFSYTISSANTWENKTITIAGDTSSTYATGNTGAVILTFSLGAGSSQSGTANSWQAANYYSATGATSVVGISGATFYITGVQLEKGSTATSFDYRPYGTELALCQRYYSKSYATDTAPATATTVNAVIWLTETTSSYTNRFITFPVTMRSTPTFTAYSPATGTSGKMRNIDTATDISVNVKNSCIYSGGFSVSTSNELNVHWTASAEL
jgi:hypothetical protein